MSDYERLKSVLDLFEKHGAPVTQNTFVFVGDRKFFYKETPTGGEWSEVVDE